MQARDVMTSNVVSVTSRTPVHDIVRLLMKHRISAVPVVDSDQQVVGIVSEGDLLAAPEDLYGKQAWWLVGLMLGGTLDYESLHASTASEVMTRRVIAVEEDAELSDVAKTLEREHIKRVPVVRDGKLVGIVSRANLLHGLANDIIERHEPGMAEDRALRVRVVNVLMHEPSLEPYLVNVTVKDGAVRLWGVVSDETARMNAARIAQDIPGVESVENNLGSGPVSGMPV
jgi:CBS-domain-containing membrane protein